MGSRDLDLKFLSLVKESGGSVSVYRMVFLLNGFLAYLDPLSISGENESHSILMTFGAKVELHPVFSG